MARISNTARLILASVFLAAVLAAGGNARGADDFVVRNNLAVVNDRIMKSTEILAHLHALDQAISGDCLDRYCASINRTRQGLAGLKVQLDKAIAQTRGILQWTSDMAGYNNEAEFEQYVRRNVAGKELALSVSNALLDFSDIITGDLTKLAGAMNKALRESGADVYVGNIAGGAVTGGFGDYGVFSQVNVAGESEGVAAAGGGGKPKARVSREALQGALKGAIGPIITMAFRKAGISDESMLGEATRETVNQAVGFLVDKYTAAAGKAVEINPLVLSGVIIKSAGAALARQQLSRLRGDISDVYETMGEFEKKRLFFVRQWKLHSRLWRQLKDARTRVMGLLDRTAKLGCKELSALPADLDTKHPVPYWKNHTPDPDPMLEQAVQISERLLRLPTTIGQCWVGGKVMDDKQQPLPGVRVMLDLNGKEYAVLSGKQGRFRFWIPKSVTLPLAVFLTARKKGYAAGSATVIQREFEHADITLIRYSANIIDLAPELHHLGNGKYGGAINSQFQRPDAEGVSLKRRFTVQDSVLFDPHRQPFLVMEAKGLQDKNPVLLNGKQVAVLASSDASGAASRLEIAIDPCALKSGENILEIRTADTDGNGDVDDFEIANVQLHFRPVAQQASTKESKMTSLDAVRLVGADGSPVKKVVINETFTIEGKGKGKCGVRPDVATVFVFPQSGGEEAGRSVTLVETGPDTGVFHTEHPLKPGDIPVKVGDRIVVRAGLRAASALVTPTAEQIAEQKRRQALLDAAAKADQEYRQARKQWKQLSDFIDEQRAKGRNVDDLMANLRKLAEKVKQTRARALDARRKAGLETGSITVGGKPWDGTKPSSKP